MAGYPYTLELSLDPLVRRMICIDFEGIFVFELRVEDDVAGIGYATYIEADFQRLETRYLSQKPFEFLFDTPGGISPLIGRVAADAPHDDMFDHISRSF
jgi:hypothetical protein